ncbi:uncharacterized protein Z520_12168 [Fonsecaea multimorphosa CBS 102226]|uniref:Kinesin light chain n=1 Tax=Fonsecaea multimorphosa CBS 102226 TaxID=1442371 RepID=A0A0D2GRN2_9EURO|nr:uncharacterized protein Z520_12168 [Fonsecaea multimorphosa CBS 102226]KIX92175.1 hypothetical protein Z520_12168 [Fonsecaea multimorphosa CBS 102226]
MHNFAIVRDKTGHLEPALALMSECVEIERQRRYGDNPPQDSIVSLQWLAIFSNKAGRHEEAVTQMEECLHISLEAFGEDHAETISARAWLEEWSREEKGEKDEEKDEEKEKGSSDNVELELLQEESVSKPSDNSSPRKRFKHALSGVLRGNSATRKRK